MKISRCQMQDVFCFIINRCQTLHIHPSLVLQRYMFSEQSQEKFWFSVFREDTRYTLRSHPHLAQLLRTVKHNTLPFIVVHWPPFTLRRTVPDYGYVIMKCPFLQKAHTRNRGPSTWRRHREHHCNFIDFMAYFESYCSEMHSHIPGFFDYTRQPIEK